MENHFSELKFCFLTKMNVCSINLALVKVLGLFKRFLAVWQGFYERYYKIISRCYGNGNSFS